MDESRREWLEGLRARLEARRGEHLYRSLRKVETGQGPVLRIEGREYVQFCTNNYLGLANDGEVIEAARAATARYGTGAGASRLVAGSMALHHELEGALARFKRTEAALVFPTGFMANLAVLTTFAGPGDVIVSDKLNHASLLDGARYSGALHRTYPHRAYGRAEELLDKPRRHEGTKDDVGEETTGGREGGRRFLVTDTVFSMDGDVADLAQACGVAERAGALMVVDEAHATGVLGTRGAGVAEMQGVEGGVALSVGTLSKALGSVGGFVAGAGEAIETLINEARSFIYTTGLPPGCSAAALAALGIVEREPGRRERVMSLARQVKGSLVGMGYDCGDSAAAASPIVPVILGESEAAVRAGEFLREKGLYVPAIRPPTVAPKTARLRISLMATHTDGQVGRLLEAMGALRAHGAGMRDR